MIPEAVYIPVPGGRVFSWQWGEGPLLIFTHATGMCAQLYLELLGPLGRQYRVVAYDARGHGRTELETDLGLVQEDWDLYRSDLKAICAALTDQPIRLAGHSFGASTAFEAAIDHPGLASSVLMIDPAFIPPPAHLHYREARAKNQMFSDPMSEQAARRRAVFPSKEAMFASYQGRGVFTGWSDEALQNYIEGGTRPHPDGVELSCNPRWESNSYRGVNTRLSESMARADFPFILLSAEHGTLVPEAAEAQFQKQQPNAIFRRFAGTGHFLPVTHPDLVRPYFDLLT